MRRFGFAAAGALVPLVVITFLVGLAAENVFGDLIRDAGQALSALAALISCGLLAHRSSGRLRWAWGLIATSAGIALVAELLEGGYTIATGSSPAFLAAADVGLAPAMPAAIAGLILFPGQEHLHASRRRAALDLVTVALSLTFVSGALSLQDLFVRFASPGITWLGLAFAGIDVALLTTVFFSLRQSLPQHRARLALVLAGLSLNAIAASASVVLAASGHLPALRELLGSGSMYGFALVALAPLWPERTDTPEEQGIALWPALIPYLGVGAVGATAGLMWLLNQPINSFVVLPGVGLAGVLIASQILSISEARTLLRQSRLAERELRDREALLNNVIDHAPQGVAAISVDRCITNANPRLASMLYVPLPVLVGSCTDSYLPEDYVNRVFRSFRTRGDGSSETYESDCQARRADGSQFWIHWSTTPIRRPDGSVDYFMATFEDVTAKREAEETAVANLAQLEKLNRLKSDFVAMVSHEFRTALVGIQGFSELIKEQEMDPTEVKVLGEEIYNDALRLNRMITEMLDFDRLEAGKLRIDLRPLDINTLVRTAVDRAALTTKKHSVRAELQPGLPAVLGDSDRLTQVLTNLLSNAIKYSPDGGDVCARTHLNGGSVEVSVKDHGRGIPPEFISRLFGKYERYEDKHAGKIIGTGLGLAITRQIVEMHGGRVTVDSVVGRGSEFRFTVPLAATVAAAITRSA